MKDTGIVTKITKMNISRIALCKNPADQDANFVLVKSEYKDDEDPKEEKPGDEKDDKEPDADADEKDGDKAKEKKEDKEDDKMKKSSDEGPTAIELKIDAEGIAKSIEEAVSAAIQKSPQIAYLGGDLNPGPGGKRVGETSAYGIPDDDGGKEAIQECVKSLVQKCNDSKVTPKEIKKAVSDIAKFHGVEGPNIDDDGSAGVFSEVTTELKTLVEVLKALVVAAPKMAAPAPAPAASAATKKSMDSPAVQALKKEFEKVRFELLQALGKDPTPLTE